MTYTDTFPTQAWNLVFVSLDVGSICKLSCVSHTLRLAAQAILQRRSEDISLDSETRPIAVLTRYSSQTSCSSTPSHAKNHTHTHTHTYTHTHTHTHTHTYHTHHRSSKQILPVDFVYSSRIEAQHLPILQDAGCACADGCGSAAEGWSRTQNSNRNSCVDLREHAGGCKCGARGVEEELVVLNSSKCGAEPLRPSAPNINGNYIECGPACLCCNASQGTGNANPRSCRNRLTQQGVKWKLQLELGDKVCVCVNSRLLSLFCVRSKQV